LGRTAHFAGSRANFATRRDQGCASPYAALSQMSAEDQQIVNHRNFSVSDVARVFGVPPHILADPSRSTFASAREASRQFATQTLSPWVSKLQRAFAMSVLGASHRLVIDLGDLLRADPEARWASWQRARQAGVLSPNDIRIEEGWPASSDPTADSIESPVDGLPLTARVHLHRSPRRHPTKARWHGSTSTEIGMSPRRKTLGRGLHVRLCRREAVDKSIAFPNLEAVIFCCAAKLTKLGFCLHDQAFVSAAAKKRNILNAPLTHQVASHGLGSPLSLASRVARRVPSGNNHE
jgi:hypothetical protein